MLKEMSPGRLTIGSDSTPFYCGITCTGLFKLSTGLVSLSSGLDSNWREGYGPTLISLIHLDLWFEELSLSSGFVRAGTTGTIGTTGTAGNYNLITEF